MTLNEIKTALTRKRGINVSQHPTDKNAIVLSGMTMKKLGIISSMFCCSGYMASEDTAVVTNFGMYH